MKAYIGRYQKDESKERKISIRVDKWDSWNADATIALIAVPILRQLKETKHGAPCTDDDDVPEHIRSTAAKPKENEYDIDEFHFARWDWIMDEMIYSLNEVANGNPGDDEFYDWSEVDENAGVMDQIEKLKVDSDGLKAYHERIQNGCRLFGKYFQNLWD